MGQFYSLCRFLPPKCNRTVVHFCLGSAKLGVVQHACNFSTQRRKQGDCHKAQDYIGAAKLERDIHQGPALGENVQNCQKDRLLF